MQQPIQVILVHHRTRSQTEKIVGRLSRSVLRGSLQFLLEIFMTYVCLDQTVIEFFGVLGPFEFAFLSFDKFLNVIGFLIIIIIIIVVFVVFVFLLLFLF